MPNFSEFEFHPSAYLWFKEFENSNEMRTEIPVLKYLDLKTRQRGRFHVDGFDWPGHIRLPSTVIRELIENGKIFIPSRWANKFGDKSSKVVSIIYSWSKNKEIFKMDEFASQLAFNSTLSINLTTDNFSLMHNDVYYVEFGDLKPDINGKSPHGFFFGYDLNDRGDIECVLLLDFINGLEIVKIPLSNHSFDLTLMIFKKVFEKSAPDNDSLGFAMANHNKSRFDPDLIACCISSMLMITGGYSHHKFGGSYSSESGVNKILVNGCFNSEINRSYYSISRDTKKPPIITSQWVDRSVKGAPELFCIMTPQR